MCRPDDACRLRAAGVIATLLPCAAFYLKLGPLPRRHAI
jgi:hypothetical protein